MYVVHCTCYLVNIGFSRWEIIAYLIRSIELKDNDKLM